MKIPPEKLKNLGGALDKIREDYGDVIDDDQWIQKHVDGAREYVHAKYDRIAENGPKQ